MGSERSFGDFAAKLRKSKPEPEPAPVVQPDFDTVYMLRRRVLGVLLRDARRNAEYSVEECAAMVGVTPETFLSWEYGEGSPSLPEVELLAYMLDVPVNHFWGVETLASTQQDRLIPKVDFLSLRNRIIGAHIRRSRKEAQLAPADLARRIGVEEEELKQYEFGQRAVSLPVLQSIASATNVAIGYFLEQTSRVGVELELGQDFKRFKEMPPEMRHFVVQPMNQSYLDLAMRLSRMSVDELRAIAESILNITY